MTGIPHAHEPTPPRTRDVEVAHIPSHTVDVPGKGRIVLRQADGARIGTIAIDERDEQIVFTLVHGGCRCGCRCGCAAAGHGLILALPVDEARTYAARLTELADRIEGAAAAAARDVIARAGRR